MTTSAPPVTEPDPSALICSGDLVGPCSGCQRTVEVAAADDQTALAIQELLAGRWATAPDDRTPREPGEPGVRLRCYLDVRQALNT
ncbi:MULTISPECIES: DUF6207 family protein [Streptomyces]|uniref:DUF6207 family protein n=1 Tax=Streptomyces TaxID=1883 RepID=UPI000AD089C0|nr:DUF6207 family protein [Streptomyces sp. NRRL S-146]